MDNNIANSQKQAKRQSKEREIFLKTRLSSISNLSPIPKIMTKHFEWTSLIQNGENDSGISGLSISKLNGEAVKEFGVFDTDSPMKPRPPLCYLNSVRKDINSLNGCMSILSRKPGSRAGRASCFEAPKSFASKESLKVFKIHKIKKPVGKPPIPISLKLGQLSKPNDSSIFQRRLQQGAMKSRNLGLIGDFQSRNCNTPSLKSNPNFCLNLNPCAPSVQEIIMKKIKLKILLRAYLKLKQTLGFNCMLTVLTGGLLLQTSCPFETKVNRIVSEIIRNQRSSNQFKTINNDISRIKRSDNPEAVQNILCRRKGKQQLLVMRKSVKCPLSKKVEEKNLLR